MNINWFFISSLTLTITMFFLIVILLRYGKEKIHKLWLFFNFTLFIWGFGATLASKMISIELSNIFWRISLIGVTFTSPSWSHFVYFLIKREIIKKVKFFAYLQAFVFTFFLLKTDLVVGMPKNFFYKNFFVPLAGPLYVFWFLSWFLIFFVNHCYLFRFVLKEKNVIDLKLLEIGIFLAFIGTFNFSLPFNFTPFQFVNFIVAFYALITTYAIFKHQLLGIEIIFKKGLSYSLFIGVLTGIYLLMIMGAEWIFRGIIGYKSLIISFTAAFIIALLFNPLRNKIQALVDHLFLGKTPHEIAKENESLRQELERSERLKAASTLALGLAHEIKNPLTTIKTFAEYLPEKYKDEDFVNKFSKIIPSEVERINNIIHQLLDFSKPSPPAFKDTNIHNLISDILAFLNSSFLKNRIKVKESYGDSTLVIKIDPIQIKQALLNIILNAIEAMPNGGTISINTMLKEKDHLEIKITDDGCGIAEKDLKHIFDPFYSKKESGTGLGLAITHQIIKNHKGTITVESELGKGTTFRIRLPMEL